MSLDLPQKGIGRYSFGFKVTVSPQSHNVKDFKLEVRQVKLQAHGNLLRVPLTCMRMRSLNCSARAGSLFLKLKDVCLYAQSAG